MCHSDQLVSLLICTCFKLDLSCHSTLKINGLYTTLIGNNCIHLGLLTLIASVNKPMLRFVRINDRPTRFSSHWI